MTWESFIEAAPAGEHAVQLYQEPGELIGAVARYLEVGFAAGEPAVVIATGDHRQRLLSELQRLGRRPAELAEQRLLTLREADETLSAFMEDGIPSRERFISVVGGLLDEVAAHFPGRTTRAFGEMVDLLWQESQQRAAIMLEELWNELAQTRRFALLCGYQLDPFEVSVQRDALPEFVRVHTHARSVADPRRLPAAVDQSLAELVGAVGAARIYLDVAEQMPRNGLPRAQSLLIWLSQHDSSLACKLLERVRRHYAQALLRADPPLSRAEPAHSR